MQQHQRREKINKKNKDDIFIPALEKRQLYIDCRRCLPSRYDLQQADWQKKQNINKLYIFIEKLALETESD